MIKVFGHQSPDTDTTGSAIIWAWYLNEHTTNDATPYILGELNSETQFVLSTWNIPTPTLLENLDENDRVVIVDTNNPKELPAGIDSVEIVEIIDHHMLVGGLSTNVPPTITMRPLACTATIMYDLIGEDVDTMPDEIAGVMLSCILSDTLGFRSPTTTPHDKDVAEKLAKKLGVDIDKYADELLKAKSDISGFTDIGLVKLDSKKFELGDKNLRVSVIETTDPTTVLERKEGLVGAIKEIIAAESDVDEVLFFIVDILKEESVALTYNEMTKSIISSSFAVSCDQDTEILPGVISRKKQILPALKA